MSSKQILVTGGAGYVGTACVQNLCQKGFAVVAVDNLTNGQKELVDKRANFYQIDILDYEKLAAIFEKHNFKSVIHLAAHKSATESVTNPDLYLENNYGLENILKLIVKHQIFQIIFPSTAAVYGFAKDLPIDENHPCQPQNNYGLSKLNGEELIKKYSAQHNFEYLIFRIFNIAGDAGLKFNNPRLKNFFNYVQDTLHGKQEELLVYGNGEYRRDFVHIQDVVQALCLALDFTGSDILNLGQGQSFSLNEVVAEFEEQLAAPLNKKILLEKRAADPLDSRASIAKIEKVLNWQPTFDLKQIVASSLF